MTPINIDNLVPELEERGISVSAECRDDAVRLRFERAGECWFVTCDGEQCFRRALLEFATSIGLSVEWWGIVWIPGPADVKRIAG